MLPDISYLNEDAVIFKLVKYFGLITTFWISLQWRIWPCLYRNVLFIFFSHIILLLFGKAKWHLAGEKWNVICSIRFVWRIPLTLLWIEGSWNTVLLSIYSTCRLSIAGKVFHSFCLEDSLNSLWIEGTWNTIRLAIYSACRLSL